MSKSNPLRVVIGLDRLPDYRLLRSRGMTRDEAIAHIHSGAPVLRKYGAVVPKVTTLQAVKLAADAMRLSPKEVLSRGLSRPLVDCRAVVTMVMHRQGVAAAQIGRRLNRDHTSIIHLRRTFPQRAAQRPVLARIVETIMEAA